MLSNPSSGRRLSGRILLVATVAVALPLTATRAIQYVDVPMLNAPSVEKPAPLAPIAAVASVAQPEKVAAERRHSNLSINDGMVTMNGQTKRWKDLTPAEKAEVRKSLAEARAELARVNNGEIQREVQSAMREARMNREEMQRELAQARIEVDEAMREIDAHSAELRRAGQDPEQIKATVRASLKAVEAIDVEKITREAMASVDPATINAAMAAAQAGLDKAEAELERAEDAHDKNDD